MVLNTSEYHRVCPCPPAEQTLSRGQGTGAVRTEQSQNYTTRGRKQSCDTNKTIYKLSEDFLSYPITTYPVYTSIIYIYIYLGRFSTSVATNSR